MLAKQKHKNQLVFLATRFGMEPLVILKLI